MALEIAIMMSSIWNVSLFLLYGYKIISIRLEYKQLRQNVSFLQPRCQSWIVTKENSQPGILRYKLAFFAIEEFVKKKHCYKTKYLQAEEIIYYVNYELIVNPPTHLNDV